MKFLSLGFPVLAWLIGNSDGAYTINLQARHDKIAPKVFIISMFAPEALVWYRNKQPYDLLAKNITVPGLAPLYPAAHCTADYQVCQITTAEAEINAAISTYSLFSSDLFDLTKTYFLIAGIAGVSPEVATTGSVTFARYAVQVALAYEIDAREMPSNFTTGYFPLGAFSPSQYPGNLYGTEVFEVNDPLRKLAVGYAKKATLNDTEEAKTYRANYAANTPGSAPPSVVECDVATADVYYSGKLLSEAFANTTKLFTNGTATYCTTAQEDNATLESLLRVTLQKKVDYNRVIVMRTASDFDRPYPGEDAAYNLLYAPVGGFVPSIENIFLAGKEVINGILTNWDTTFKNGVTPQNYTGDIFGSLGGTPDFGRGSRFSGKIATLGKRTIRKRSVRGRNARRFA